MVRNFIFFRVEFSGDSVSQCVGHIGLPTQNVDG